MIIGLNNGLIDANRGASKGIVMVDSSCSQKCIYEAKNVFSEKGYDVLVFREYNLICANGFCPVARLFARGDTILATVVSPANAHYAPEIASTVAVYSPAVSPPFVAIPGGAVVAFNSGDYVVENDIDIRVYNGKRRIYYGKLVGEAYWVEAVALAAWLEYLYAKVAPSVSRISVELSPGEMGGWILLDGVRLPSPLTGRGNEMDIYREAAEELELKAAVLLHRLYSSRRLNTGFYARTRKVVLGVEELFLKRLALETMAVRLIAGSGVADEARRLYGEEEAYVLEACGKIALEKPWMIERIGKNTYCICGGAIYRPKEEHTLSPGESCGTGIGDIRSLARASLTDGAFTWLGYKWVERILSIPADDKGDDQ